MAVWQAYEFFAAGIYLIKITIVVIIIIIYNEIYKMLL